MNSPHDFFTPLFENNRGKLRPIRGNDKKLRLILNPNREIIHAVTVVPILAPIMTATAPVSDKSPAFTKLTTITVVADEDWIVVVTNIPVKTPLKRLFVNAPKI